MVPFETLAITGGPSDDLDGRGVSLDTDVLFEKIVDRERGGFCYELNGLFGELLAELGFDVDRVAGRVLSDGEARPPANHLTLIVALDQRYVVDAGTGTPPIRRPLPLDGAVRKDDAGVVRRVAESTRPDADYKMQYREPDEDSWSDHYVFTDASRELDYFQATCDFLETAPESPFTGDPVVTIATDRGYKKLTPDELTVTESGETREQSVVPAEWHDVLEREFGL